MTFLEPHFSLKRCKRNGVSLIEATIALALTAVAGTVLLLTVETAVETNDKTTANLIAKGLATQLADEILGKYYKASGVSPYQQPLAAGGHESFTLDGMPLYYAYDDIDDFVSYWSSPPRDGWGNDRGIDDGEGNARHPNFQVRPGYFTDWKWTTTVKYVSETNHAVDLSSGTSNYRSVTVVVSRQQNGIDRELARVRRVVAYVPVTP